MAIFKRAERMAVRLKIALEGPSGSGKSYSALRIARGMHPTGRIAVIDTENGSASLYSGLTEFDVLDVAPPFTPEKYVDAINAAVAEKYDVLVIDSLSHEWSGKGGVLEIHDSMPGNSWANWAKVTPRHDKFIQTILQAPIDIISTLRSKASYEVDEKDGKKTPKKIGLQAIQRDGLDYEFTLVLTLDISHQAQGTKDRTTLFPLGEWFQPDEGTGGRLRAWRDTGAAPVAVAMADPAEVKAVLNDLVSKGMDKGEVWNIAVTLTGKTAIERMTADDLAALRAHDWPLAGAA